MVDPEVPRTDIAKFTVEPETRFFAIQLVLLSDLHVPAEVFTFTRETAPKESLTVHFILTVPALGEVTTGTSLIFPGIIFPEESTCKRR